MRVEISRHGMLELKQLSRFKHGHLGGPELTLWILSGNRRVVHDRMTLISQGVCNQWCVPMRGSINGQRDFVAVDFDETRHRPVEVVSDAASNQEYGDATAITGWFNQTCVKGPSLGPLHGEFMLGVPTKDEQACCGGEDQLGSTLRYESIRATSPSLPPMLLPCSMPTMPS